MNTILSTRNMSAVLIASSLEPEQAQRLREKLGEVFPGERFTIVFGEMPMPQVGPQEYKVQDYTALPRFEG